MNLIIDAGNTLIKTAVFDHEYLSALTSSPTWRKSGFVSLLDSAPLICQAIGSSTREVPAWLPRLFAERNIPYIELRHDIPLPIRLGYLTPETLGKDRIAAAAGAAALFPGKNVLAVDAGTALTIDLVTAEGVFLGGNISPGLRMRFRSLNRQTHSLPEVEPGTDVPLLGRSTHEAILAGVVNGIVYEIDNSINSLKNIYNDLTVILTGGDAQYLSLRLKNTIFVQENLVLSGLNAILRNFSGHAQSS